MKWIDVRAGATLNSSDITVVCFTGQSGLADYAVSWCREASSQGRRIRLVIGQDAEPELHDHGFSVIRLFRRTRYYPIDLPRFIRYVQKNPKAIYLIQGPIKFAMVDAIAVLALRKILRVEMACVVHDTIPHSQNAFGKYSYSVYYRSFDKLIAHTEVAKQYLRKKRISSPILVVPHGQYDMFRKTEVSREDAKRNLAHGTYPQKLVLFFGNIEKRKGIFRIPELAKALPDVTFLVAGESFLKASEIAQLQALAKSLPNLDLRLGRVPSSEVQTYFYAADAVILPYEEGSTSGVLKIALAFKRGVISSDVGDLPNEIPPGAGRIVHRSADISDWSRAVATALDERDSLEAAMARDVRDREWSAVTAPTLEFLETRTAEHGQARVGDFRESTGITRGGAR